MGTSSPLRRFLQSLCCHSCWDYAVFWKLHYRSPMLLIWEDGYCDIPKQDSAESILDESCLAGLNQSNGELNEYDGALCVNTLEQAVAYMANAQYALGDGVIGDVAYTGNYRWVFTESMFSGFNSKLVAEHPEEWLFQLAAGIKTILLVPVVPYGVLQLGSLETVAEDLAMIAYVKEKFVAQQSMMGHSESFEFDSEFLAQSLSLQTSDPLENIDGFSSLTMNGLRPSYSMAFDDIKLTTHEPVSEIQHTPPCDAAYSTYLVGMGELNSTTTSTEDDLTAQLGVLGLPDALHDSLDFNELGMIESHLNTFLEGEFPAFSYSNNLNTSVVGECAMKKSLAPNEANNMDHQSNGPFLSFPKDCELHKALGSAIMGNGNEVPVAVSRNDSESPLAPSIVESVHMDENSSSRASGESSPTISSTHYGVLGKRQNQTETSAFGEANTLSQNHATSAFISRGRNLICSASPSATSYESAITGLIGEEQKTIYGHPQQKKGSKLSGGSKKKGKPGEKQKARPRDRQLIQDRLKELRELVPSGAKCSIDGLLDRTVAHMLFLKSVSDRADKLRQCAQPEGPDRKNTKSPEKKRGNQNGACWAFELGSDNEVCPIIVEDLEYPGHMTIEMICNENGRFLEIAEVIHGLELTILKGVMHKRSGNTWAHFVIEAPRGLHRLDIFWPLMKLLQQQPSSIASKI